MRPAREGEGSWVALTFLPDGKIILAREDKGLWRYDPASGAEGALQVADDTLLECRGLLAAHGALYANANNSGAFCRLRDADGDGRFEQVETLRVTPGGVGHGRNQLALGPDGAIYSIHGDDVQAPKEGFTAGSAYAHGGDDRMLPFAWDRFNWSHTVHPPAGHLVRTDADGKSWQIVCGGLRNPFGIAFNEDGEAFTYDADIEWDVGLPWYRPTRVLHLVSGADYGWRGGSRALPAWMPDTAPAALDIGKGSPTAIRFGTKSTWPAPWRNALFISDWAYGIIHAVHLTANGASYRGKHSPFVQGRPLNVTGLEFGPDGALYFTTGGRRTQSGLYRVVWKGATESSAPTSSDPSAPSATAPDAAASREARTLRRRLEAFHGRADSVAFDTAWEHLDHPDPWVRQAARIALETDPACAEKACDRRAVTPVGQLTGFLAAARTCRDARQAAMVFSRLGAFSGGEDTRPAWLDAPDSQRLFLRIIEVLLVRHPGDTPAGIQLPTGPAAPLYSRVPQFLPNPDHSCGRLACEVMAAWQHPETVVRTLQALATTQPPPTQEDALHYLVTLRTVRTGWTLDFRRQWLAWLLRARSEFSGSSALPSTLNYLRAEFEGALTDQEKSELARELAALDQTAATAVPPPARPFLKAWTMADFTDDIAAAPGPVDPARGRKVFAEATCAACHRAAPGVPKGGAIGPDLTGVGQRFDRHALFESILDPWKAIAPQYKNASATLQSGAIHEGRVLSEDAESLRIVTNPVEPESATAVPRRQVTRLLEMSAMPPGLLNGFTREEILELVAWLQAGAP